MASKNTVKMSQDIVSDALNQIMNALNSGKNSIVLTRHSKLLIDLLAIAKLKGQIKSYHLEGSKLTIVFDKLNMFKSIKPRYLVKVGDIEKFKKRYLPAKDLGTIVLSTNQGLMTHQTAIEKNIGGSLIAYFY